MKKLQDTNPNTQEYWSTRYKGLKNRKDYEAETGTSRFYRAIEEIKPNSKVLDIGCGIGTFCHMAKSIAQAEVWGVDISEEVIYGNKLESTDIKYFCNVVGDLKDIPKDYFDFVFSGETLEHIDDPNQLFKDAYSVLKTGGKLLITTPDRNKINSAEHVWSYDHDDVKKLFEANGFTKVRFIYLSNGEHLLIIMATGIKV